MTHVNIAPNSCGLKLCFFVLLCLAPAQSRQCTGLQECYRHLLPLVACQDARVPECAVLEGCLVQEACASTHLLLTPADRPLVRPTCQLLLHPGKHWGPVLKDAACSAHCTCLRQSNSGNSTQWLHSGRDIPPNKRLFPQALRSVLTYAFG